MTEGEAPPHSLTEEEAEALHRENSRKSAIVLASAAIRAGAQPSAPDKELDPCGLDVVLDAIFGPEIDLVRKVEDDDG